MPVPKLNIVHPPVNNKKPEQSALASKIISATKNTPQTVSSLTAIQERNFKQLNLEKPTGIMAKQMLELTENAKKEKGRDDLFIFMDWTKLLEDSISVRARRGFQSIVVPCREIAEWMPSYCDDVRSYHGDYPQLCIESFSLPFPKIREL